MSDIMAYFYGFIDLKEYIRRRKENETKANSLDNQKAPEGSEEIVR
jgi:hypothetical protein